MSPTRLTMVVNRRSSGKSCPTPTPLQNAPPGTTPSPTRLLLLLPLFMGSGCAALVYEIVWLQLLQLVIGSTAVSLGVLLGTFMGGMCLGSLLLPRFISPRRHPLRVYAALELGIGVIAIAVLYGMPHIEKLYTGAAGGGWIASLALRGLLSMVCLLPPAMLMGATLPALSRWVETTPKGVSWLGFLYGANIAGAVAGCLLAGFYLLRVYDMAATTYFAVAVNLGVSAISVALSAVWSYRPAAIARPEAKSRPAAGPWSVYIVIALSGLTALGAEVVWTRLLSLLLGGTVYTFSAILALFLLGLGIGSAAGSFLARTARPRLALGYCQLLLAGAIAWAAWALSDSLPFWPINPDDFHRVRGSRFSWTCCAACTWCCRRRSFGERVFRWRWRPPRNRGRTRGGWWRASMRPTRSERSWGRWPSACC